ncbi:glycoside hydrolase family 51 protein [Xylariaceae sp. FL1019]|nr:glycoside hydrolase family 51 protein [Xylariaceae sp. FL1019]
MANVKELAVALLLLASMAVGKTTIRTTNIVVRAEGGNVTGGFQYGFLHEDINHSGDGGLYAELIRNRAFQGSETYPISLSGWSSVNRAALSLKNLTQPLSKALPVSMNVASYGKGGQIGFVNDGYWGMDIKRQKYTGSFWVKGDYHGDFTASVQSNITGEKFGATKVKSKSRANEWTEHKFDLTPYKNAPSSNNTFGITFESKGLNSSSLDFNLISLFPPTFKNRPNGMRLDLAEALAQIHPTIFRMPGGNMLEGLTNATWWNWKNSIGPLKDRPGFNGVWGYEQTNGLGLYEYLQYAEDMGMEIVLAVYAGLALNGDVTPKEDLQPFIDDALEEIEFITGSPDSKWGRVRAQLGHPEPWKLPYVEIGNEDWLAGGAEGWSTYMAYRFPMFLEAINKACRTNIDLLASDPDIKVLSSGSIYDGYNIPAPGGGDCHIYGTPDVYVENFDEFDNVTIPHLLGEMAAVHPNGGTAWDGPLQPFPWWGGAVSLSIVEVFHQLPHRDIPPKLNVAKPLGPQVGEAIGLISYERNAPRVFGAVYAPIVRNMNRWEWSITMIQFAADPKLTTRSTSWYVWELMAAHPITETLPATEDFGPLYYVAGKNEQTGGHLFKAAVYNSTNSAPVPVQLTFEDVAPFSAAELTVLTGPEDPYGFNDPFANEINVVKTVKSTVRADKFGTFSLSLPNLSVAVLDTKGPKKGNRRGNSP